MTLRNKLIMIRVKVPEGDDRIQDGVEDIREASQTRSTVPNAVVGNASGCSQTGRRRMIKRQLGDLQVGAIGLGCMGMAVVYGRPDPTEARATIDQALDRGVTLLDTADMYGNGASERFVGNAIRGRRERVVLATKTGITTRRFTGMPKGVDGQPDRIRRAAEESLRRLGTDYVDLYYLHRVDPRVPIEESVGAIADLVTAGKARAVGVSEVSPEELRRAHAIHPVAAVQMEWSLFSRELESELVPTARDLGVGLVAYSPLGRGMLTGSAQATTDLPLIDYRRFLPRWRRANLAANLRSVEKVAAVARRIGATPGQVALAWVLSRGDDVVPIPGTKRPRYLQENLRALEVQLDAEALSDLETLTVAGDRDASGPGAGRS
jgi:aryl-alcohol dehydrogenase-like predicted oxidoreductase